MSEKLSEKKPRTTLDRDLAVGFLLAVIICVIGFFVSAHFVNIGNNATEFVSDGKKLFAPGRLLHDRALAGMVTSFVALLVIGALYTNRRKLPHTLVVVAITSMLALVAVLFAANTWQSYRSFGVF